MLRKIPFLQDVDSVVLEELLLRLESRTCMQWDLVVRQGDPGDWMGFISSGTIAVLDPHERERDVLIKLLRAGAHFGELAIFKPKDSTRTHRRAASLQAMSWVQMQVVTRTEWAAIEALYPKEVNFCHEKIHAHVSTAQYAHFTTHIGSEAAMRARVGRRTSKKPALKTLESEGEREGGSLSRRSAASLERRAGTASDDEEEKVETRPRPRSARH